MPSKIVIVLAVATLVVVEPDFGRFSELLVLMKLYFLDNKVSNRCFH